MATVATPMATVLVDARYVANTTHGVVATQGRNDGQPDAITPHRNTSLVNVTVSNDCR